MLSRITTVSFKGVEAQKIVVEDEPHKGVVVLAVVGRVGKDEVVLHLVLLEEAESVGTDDEQLAHVEFVGCVTDELHAAEVLVDGNDLGAAARHQLIRNVARAGKQVQGLGLLKVEMVLDDVEQTLLGHVGGGTNRQVGRGRDLSPLVSSSDDSHFLF